MNGWRKRLGFRNCILGAIFLALAAWLATGFAFVPPKSVKVFYGFTGFLNGELQSNKVAHFNFGDGHKLIWKGPIIPEFNKQNKIGREKETISLNLLNVNGELPLWAKDEETGNPNDHNTVFSVVFSGTLDIKNWGKFLEAYDPDEANAELRKDDPSFPRLGTMDFFVESALKTGIISTLSEVVGDLPDDAYYRYSIAQSVIETDLGGNTADGIKDILQNKYPWVWTLGAKAYLIAYQNPQAFAQYVQSSPPLYYLLAVVDYEQFQARLPDAVNAINAQITAIGATTKPELLEKVVSMFDKFQGYMKAKNRDLGFYSQNTLALEVSQFVRQYGYGVEESIVFADLVSLKWEWAVLEKAAAEKKKDYDTAAQFFRALPEFNDSLNMYVWQLAIREALNRPDESPEDVSERILYALVKHPEVWERALSEFPESEYGVWEIKDLSFALEDRPMFTDDGQVDKDFYWLYKQREADSR